MNLRNWIENLSAPLFFQRARARFCERIFGQNIPVGLLFHMPLSFARRAAVCFCWGLFLVFLPAVFAQTNYYTTNGTEYEVVGSLPGDQVFPDAAVTPSGGFFVWQDNATDGSGWGVSARKVDGTLSGTLGTFRVNVTGTNDQENARVGLLKNGGAIFAWQGGVQGYQGIYARFLTSTNTWMTTNDVLVNTSTNNFQINPAVAVLDNSNVVVVWAGFNQAGANSLLDVFGQVFSQTGQKIGGNFLVNQFISYNQRTPAIAPLKGGGFVVTWVSEQQRGTAPVIGTNSVYYSSATTVTPSVDIYARLYDGNAAALTGEFLVNSNFNPCANPSVAAASDGSFLITFDAFDMAAKTNEWDIYARSYSSNGVGGAIARVNTTLAKSQYAPRVSAIGTDYLVVWTSLGQDGSREGVFGQLLHGVAPVRGEFCVNTTTIGQQMQPVVTSDGVSQFLVAWTSYTGSPYSFDLFAQRYINVSAILQPMAAPFVWVPFVVSNNVYQPQLVVSWPVLLGISVSNYEVYVDGAVTPVAVVASSQVVNGQYYQWIMTTNNGLTTGITHSFQLDYVTTDGRHSPISPSASGKTWGGQSWGGIPFEWMTANYGNLTVSFAGGVPSYNWPSPNASLTPGGPSLLQIFVSGGNPFDSGTWLKTTLANTPQGMFLSWNTQPGATYQVQVKTSLTAAWSNLGAPRFAAGGSDSIYVGGSPAGYYQIELLR
jgi:hypothetical protein